MSGLPDHNFPAFFTAARYIADLGLEPINPAYGITDFDQPWDWYMRRAIRKMMDADEVWLLPGWERSKGAKIEWRLAMDIGMKCRTFIERDGELMLRDVAETSEAMSRGN